METRRTFRLVAGACVGSVLALAIVAAFPSGPASSSAGENIPDQPLSRSPEVEAQRLADQLGPCFDVVLTDHFAIVTDASHEFRQDAALALEDTSRAFPRLAQELYLDPAPLRERVLVVLFDDRWDFLNFAEETDCLDASWMGGYYSAQAGRIVAFDDRSSPAFASALHSSNVVLRAIAEGQVVEATRAKLSHEAAHALAHHSGLQRLDGSEPEWFTEGLACFVANRVAGVEAIAYEHHAEAYSDYAERFRAIAQADPLRMRRMIDEGSGRTSQTVFASAPLE